MISNLKLAFVPLNMNAIKCSTTPPPSGVEAFSPAYCNRLSEHDLIFGGFLANPNNLNVMTVFKTLSFFSHLSLIGFLARVWTSLTVLQDTASIVTPVFD